MKHIFNKSTLTDFWYSFYNSHLPTKRDNLNRIILKSIFLLSIIILVIFFIFITTHFTKINNEQSLFLENNQIFEQLTSVNSKNYEKAFKYFKSQNSDFKAWVSVENTSISSPVYQTKNNEFYLSHNQLKQKSSFGALFFDSKDCITSKTKDQNLIIYGNSPKSDSLFSCLKNYKSIYFYKQNPYINLSTSEDLEKYIIFATFIINSNPKDDGNYIFDYKKSNFENSDEFSFWIDELSQRSLYSTEIDITNSDNLLTLVTDSVEFNGAKLVVMARKLRENEKVNIFNTQINKKPRYPDIYYSLRGIENPFNIKEADYVS